MKVLRAFRLFVAVFILIGCSSGKATTGGSGGPATLSDAEYNTLSPENQYIVANTLLATLFKGIPAKDFFDFTVGTSPLKVSGGGNFISKIHGALATPLPDRDYYLIGVDTKYNFDDSLKPQQYPLALLFEFPLSKDLYDNWMAYKLANTVLFSPAVELDTVDVTDTQKVLYRLTRMIREDQPIREIVFEHMISQENWRRFRSPEDNTREMMEILLARFKDEEVPKAAIACKNWHLTGESQGYQLVIDYDENSAAQQILDTTVVSCYDFYRAVSNHGSLIPTIVSVLVNHFFAAASSGEKQQLANELVAANPSTFRQLFSAILFSKAYLLQNTRPKGHEETFFNLAHRIAWYADIDFFRYLAMPPDSWSGIETLHQMKQAAMTYKLGRMEVPLDSLSFSYYHKSVRSRLLIDRKTNADNVYDRGWQADFLSVNLTGDDFIQYLFLSVLSRKASEQELTTIKQVITTRGYTSETQKAQKAMIVLDYCSRLSELYYLRAIQ
jgi:hypothetical protein